MLFEGKAIRISDPVSLLDIAPTILGIMKFNKPLIYQGRNLIKRKSEKNNKICGLSQPIGPVEQLNSGKYWDTCADEFIRLASPTMHFRRTATQDYQLHDKLIRVLFLYT